VENRETYNGKTPFYMTYPMQNLYLAEMEYEKDMERMKEMYPKEISELQRMVERRADQMEYEGSRIYDEDPDREMLREEAEKLFMEFLRWLDEQGQMQPMPPMQPMPGQPRPPMGEPMWDPQRPGPSQMPTWESRQEGRFMLNPPREWGEIMLPNAGGNLGSMEISVSSDTALEQAQLYRDGRGNRREDRRCGENPWLCNLTEVLFQNEIYRRRCRHRRRRRWW
jgi:hypothetical protein